MPSRRAGQPREDRVLGAKPAQPYRNFTKYFRPTGKQPDDTSEAILLIRVRLQSKAPHTFSHGDPFAVCYPKMKNLVPDWTVAIVDDQPDARELLAYALKTTFPCIQILEPSSPGWLLDHFKQLPLAAVVTRYKLFGETDGLLFSALLRSGGFNGPIIMISNSEEIANKTNAAGITEFLSFDRWSELPARLAVQLQKHAVESELPESA